MFSLDKSGVELNMGAFGTVVCALMAAHVTSEVVSKAKTISVFFMAAVSPEGAHFASSYIKTPWQKLMFKTSAKIDGR